MNKRAFIAKWVIVFILGLIIYAMATLFPHSKAEETNTQPIETIIEDTLSKISIFDYQPIEGLPKRFDTVPGGNWVFRSNQPTEEQLIRILNAYDIRTIVRMNGEEGTGITPDEERQIAERLDVNYVWVNAHIGFVEDSGYVGSLEIVQPILDSGHVLIHCTAGADRTGYQVGNYLLRKGWDRDSIWNYTIKYNHWTKFIGEGRRGYIKYLEAFYPYKDWKTKYK